MAPKGMACLIGVPFDMISQGSSPWKYAAATMNLVASITDPPPMARAKFIFF